MIIPKSVFLKSLQLILFLCIPVGLSAFTNERSNFPAHSTGSLSFDVDIYQFDGPGDSSIVEIVYSVFLVNEKIPQQESQNMTSLSIDLKISDKSGQLIKSLTESASVSLYDSLNRSNFTTFFDIKRFICAPDTVLLDLKIQESFMGTQGRISQSFKIRKFDDTFSVSDIYFASHVQRGDGTSIFEKSGVLLVPNPSRLYFVSGDAPKIFVYYEINNLTYAMSNPSFYETSAVVTDMSGMEVFANPRKQLKVTSKNTSTINVVPIKEFASGVYHLTTEVIDIASGLRHEINSNFKVDRGETKQSNILPMSKEAEQKYLDQIKYIASDLEKETFNNLDARGKQEFLLHFWKSKDPDPKTVENEFMIEHFRRLSVVESRFKGGMASEMGRVYIIYGVPVDIERQTSMASSAQAVEIWTYAIDGRADFVFVDRDGDGKFVLVHSTHKNEYYNPDWEDKLK